MPNPLTNAWTRLRVAAIGSYRLPAPLSWRMLTPDRATAVQRAVLIEYLRTGNIFARSFDLGLALIFWPWKSAKRAWTLTRLHGHKVAPFRSRPLQFLQQIWLAWCHGVSPTMYYQTGMAMSPSSIRPMEWMQNGHAALLSRAFREDKKLLEINDKLFFAQIMQKHDVATPDILAVFADGEQVGPHTGSNFLQALAGRNDLYVKPIGGSVGRDQVLLRRQDDGTWAFTPSSYSSRAFRETLAGFGPQPLESSQLISLMCQLSRGCPLIIQPRLVNHPGLPDLGGPGLQAVRILSGRRDDQIVAIRAVLRLPFQDQIASQWGVDSVVDLDTGRLGSTFEDYPDPSFSDRYSTEGPVIVGLQLPCWKETLDLIRDANLALPGYSFLGWDVAITPTGPVVIEANGNYGFSSLQKAGPAPIIDEKFLSVFECWANRPKAELS